MKNILVILILVPTLVFSQSAESVLKKSIAYHDPEGVWSTLQATFFFRETRPTGPDRSTTIEINNSSGFMKINRNDEEIYEIQGESAKVLAGDKDTDRAILLRNYYLYLWGLPMKLYDESTPEITLVQDEHVGDKSCRVLRVAYESDTWYFYFDTFSRRMLQYKFYKDEAAGKGELITLSEEIVVKGIRIPKERSWYTLPEMKFLGTDILSEYK